MKLNQIVGLALLVLTIAAWMEFVERPTERNLLRALRRTLGL